MNKVIQLVSVCLLLSLGAWAQAGSSQAPKSRKAHAAGVHHMSPHAARQLSQRERQERSIMRAQQRRQAKLAHKQRKLAMKRSRHVRNSHPKGQ